MYLPPPKLASPFSIPLARRDRCRKKGAIHRQKLQPQQSNQLLAPIHRICDSKQVNVAATAGVSGGSAHKICRMIPSVAGVAKWQTHRT
jgi:hypothetical protein